MSCSVHAQLPGGRPVAVSVNGVPIARDEIMREMQTIRQANRSPLGNTPRVRVEPLLRDDQSSFPSHFLTMLSLKKPGQVIAKRVDKEIFHFI